MPADLNTRERSRALRKAHRGRAGSAQWRNQNASSAHGQHTTQLMYPPNRLTLAISSGQFRILARMRATSIRGRTGVPGTPNSTAVRRDGCIAALRLHLQSTT